MDMGGKLVPRAATGLSLQAKKIWRGRRLQKVSKQLVENLFFKVIMLCQKKSVELWKSGIFTNTTL